jgi:hypothetical protein
MSNPVVFFDLEHLSRARIVENQHLAANRGDAMSRSHAEIIEAAGEAWCLVFVLNSADRGDRRQPVEIRASLSVCGRGAAMNFSERGTLTTVGISMG